MSPVRWGSILKVHRLLRYGRLFGVMLVSKFSSGILTINTLMAVSGLFNTQSCTNFFIGYKYLLIQILEIEFVLLRFTNRELKFAVGLQLEL